MAETRLIILKALDFISIDSMMSEMEALQLSLAIATMFFGVNLSNDFINHLASL
jgi:hypothetical protein